MKQSIWQIAIAPVTAGLLVVAPLLLALLFLIWLDGVAHADPTTADTAGNYVLSLRVIDNDNPDDVAELVYRADPKATQATLFGDLASCERAQNSDLFKAQVDHLHADLGARGLNVTITPLCVHIGP
jgi:hypothetical protein